MAKKRLFKIFTSCSYVESYPVYIESDETILKLKELCSGMQAYFFMNTRIPMRCMIPEIVIAEVLCDLFDCKIVEPKDFSNYENYSLKKADVYKNYELDLQKDYEMLPFYKIEFIYECFKSIEQNIYIKQQVDNLNGYVEFIENETGLNFDEFGKADVITIV